MDRTQRIGAGLAAILIPAGVATTALAPQALAKAGVLVQVSTHRAHVGSSVRVTAVGGDDDRALQQLCVQVRRGSHWTSLRCSRPSREPAQPTAVIREAHPTRVQVRAALVYVVDHGRHNRIGATAATTVTFVR